MLYAGRPFRVRRILVAASGDPWNRWNCDNPDLDPRESTPRRRQVLVVHARRRAGGSARDSRRGFPVPVGRGTPWSGNRARGDSATVSGVPAAFEPEAGAGNWLGAGADPAHRGSPRRPRGRSQRSRPGQGSVFSAVLPLAPVATASA